MDKKYGSIDKLIEKDKQLVIDELNAQPLYCAVVKHLGFNEIGIVVLDEEKEPIGEYASLNNKDVNNKDGKIYDIVTNFTNPNITVRVKEKTLLEIIDKIEEVKANIPKYFLKYAPRFSMKFRDYLAIFAAFFKFGKKEDEKSGDTGIRTQI